MMRRPGTASRGVAGSRGRVAARRGRMSRAEALRLGGRAGRHRRPGAPARLAPGRPEEAPSLPPSARSGRRAAPQARGLRDEPSVVSSPSAAPAPEESLEERRARVHAKAQEAMDAMETSRSRRRERGAAGGRRRRDARTARGARHRAARRGTPARRRLLAPRPARRAGASRLRGATHGSAPSTRRRGAARRLLASCSRRSSSPRPRRPLRSPTSTRWRSAA